MEIEITVKIKQGIFHGKLFCDQGHDGIYEACAVWTFHCERVFRELENLGRGVSYYCATQWHVI